jgi:hypothetical protein
VIILFLRKKNIPTKVEPVPKWDGQERDLVFVERFLFLKKGHSFFLERVFGRYYLDSHSLRESM